MVDTFKLPNDGANSNYQERLDELIDWALANPGTAGARTIRKVVMDLEGEGPVGEIMFSVDDKFFNKIIGLMIEFRRTGCKLGFNSIHGNARARISGKSDSD